MDKFKDEYKKEKGFECWLEGSEYGSFSDDYVNWLESKLSTQSVSKCANDIIKYIENDAEIAMPVNELMHEDGRRLTKKEYGHVLIKYLIVELKERFC